MLQATNSRRMIAIVVKRIVAAYLISLPALVLLSAARLAAQSHVPTDLPPYETRYYVVHTDVPPDDAREAAVRMTVMAEEYARRTKDFSGAIRRKFPFYLVRRNDDFFSLG